MSSRRPKLGVELDGGNVAVGGWCTIPSSFSIELMSRAGFDWLCFDLQHALIDAPTAMTMLQAAAISGIPTFVRTSSDQPAELQRMLDAGASGVIVPAVESAEQAAAIVEACRYPPDGRRSYGPVRAAIGRADYVLEQVNREVICGVMIETSDGLERLDEILAVSGIDLVLVGPNDLAIHLGLAPGHGVIGDTHRKASAAIAAACLERGIVPAVQGGDVPGALEFAELGYRAILVATDAQLVARGAADAVGAFRAGLIEPAASAGQNHEETT